MNAGARSNQGGSNEQASRGQSGWMITFADLLSLLLTFFVLLFSMSTVQFESWKAVVETMTDQFSDQKRQIEYTPSDTNDLKRPAAGYGLNLNYLTVFFRRAVAAHAAFEGVTVTQNADMVVISIPSDLLFGRKNTDLVNGATRPLRDLAGSLSQITNKVRIGGHTDSVPISSGRYRSNWELSMARARIVAGILTDFGYKRSIAVFGYADTMLGDSPTAQDIERAERIDIVIVPERTQEGIYGLF